MMFVAAVAYISLIKAEDINGKLEVICPPFEDNVFTNRPPFSKTFLRPYNAEDEYCQCSLTEHGTTKAAILKCDFNDEKDIVLKGTLFPFRTLNVTSAYVRMKNARSAIITSDFLAAWMDAPSSALDLWHCGEVVIESTPDPHELQLFSALKTFVGVGIINCKIGNLPSPFLRDRSRGALRLKGCTVRKINAGIFHNIEEIRYMNFEDTVVEEVAGPLSSSGVITLSKREIHSWDGIEVINSTFNYIAPYSFNVTHKDILEKFIVKKSKFGKLDKGAITISGDLNASLTECSFEQLDSLAIQISVTGQMLFTNNIIEAYAPDSLLGLNCKQNSALINNTFIVPAGQSESESSRFKAQCGEPKVFYVTKSSQQKSRMLAATSSVVAIIILAVLVVAAGMLFWGWRNRSLLRYHYRRSDPPLWKEDRERASDREEDPSSSTSNDGNAVSVVHNQAFQDRNGRF